MPPRRGWGDLGETVSTKIPLLTELRSATVSAASDALFVQKPRPRVSKMERVSRKWRGRFNPPGDSENSEWISSPSTVAEQLSHPKGPIDQPQNLNQKALCETTVQIFFQPLVEQRLDGLLGMPL